MYNHVKIKITDATTGATHSFSRSTSTDPSTCLPTVASDFFSTCNCTTRFPQNVTRLSQLHFSAFVLISCIVIFLVLIKSIFSCYKPNYVLFYFYRHKTFFPPSNNVYVFISYGFIHKSIWPLFLQIVIGRIYPWLFCRFFPLGSYSCYSTLFTLIFLLIY